uniref:hydroxymethylbilane synthase n=2 Tax=Schistosoma japonicum TaxID=6182 RepID=Q86ET2_SCHJA|nr:similar to GenBank Accession Number P19356 hydroxymethylbilane synthase (hemC) in Rattus sp [Schistosoma japonicum]
MLDASSQHAVRVGSRRSNLALLQTEMAISLLKVQKPHIMFEVVEIATVGDEILDVPLSKIGDKSLFTKELEKSLLVGEVDLVVHSLKDVPSVLPTGLVLGCVFGRSSPEDVVLMAPHNRGMKLSDLPVGATVGTSSIRRVATLIRKYPHLKFISIRGNLNTRLAKLDTPSNLQKQCCTGNQSLSYDALILAKAGVERMGWVDRIDQVLSDSFYANELKGALDASSVFMGVAVTPSSEVSRLRMAIAQSLGCIVAKYLLLSGAGEILHEIRSQSTESS